MSIVPTPPIRPDIKTQEPFRYFCNMVLPAVYGDELSYYEVLCKITDYLNKNLQNTDLINEDLKALHEYVDELYNLFEQFVNSGFDDYYAEQVVQWINNHLQFIFDKVVKQVYFGLNLEGYFVAYIPDGWSDIMFDTGAVYGLDTYGRLILRWNADNSETVNQTPEKARM